MWSPAGLPGMIWTGPGVQVECQESHWTPTGFQLEFFGSEKNLTKLDFAGNHSQWIPGRFLVIIPSGFLMDSWSIPGGFLVIPGGFLMDSWSIPDGFLVNSWWIPGQFLVDSNILSETYSLLIDTYIKDPAERRPL